MPDYMNPTAGLPDQNIQGNPFWSGWNQGETQRIMAPFRQNSLDEQGLALQKARMQFGEFSSPEAVAGRKQSIAAQQANDTATVQEQPSKTQYNIAGHNAAIERMPFETREKIAELTKKYNEHKGKPEGVVFDALADAAMQVEKADPMMRGGIYKGIVEQIERTNPGVHIPERFKTYNPTGQKELQFGYMARVNSIGQAQKEQAQKAQDDAAMAREKEKGASDERTAGISASASKYVADKRSFSERPNKPDIQAKLDELTINSPAKLKAWMKANEIDDPEMAKEILKSQIDTYRTDKMQKDARLSAVDRQAMQMLLPEGHPDKKKSYTDFINEEINRLTGKTPQKATTKGTGKSRESPVEVRSEAEGQTLPKGTWVSLGKNPDGTPRIGQVK